MRLYWLRDDQRERIKDLLKLMTSLAGEADLEHLMVDGSIVRVQQQGAAKKKQHRPPRPWVSPEVA